MQFVKFFSAHLAISISKIDLRGVHFYNKSILIVYNIQCNNIFWKVQQMRIYLPLNADVGESEVCIFFIIAFHNPKHEIARLI